MLEYGELENIKNRKGEPYTWHEVQELLSEIEKQQTWIDDLQSGMNINCVYCGHNYGPSDKVNGTMREALHSHIAECPKHPLSKANSRIATLEGGIQDIREFASVGSKNHEIADQECQRIQELCDVLKQK